jgi:hypothetical protein
MISRIARASMLLATLAGLALALPALHSSATTGGFSLSIESASTGPGGLVAVDVSVTAPEPGLGSYTIDVAYDSSRLQVVSCQTIAAGCNAAYQPGTVRIAGVSFAPIVGDRTMATIVFQAIGPPGSFPLIVTPVDFYDYEGRDVSLSTSLAHGLVTVAPGATSSPIGDADCDGVLTASDSLAILDHVAHSGTAPCIPLADVNCDGRINADDAVAILAVLSATRPPLQPAC